VGWVFFPLDEELALTKESLTPRHEEHLVHLATWMPFARAAQMLEKLMGVQVSEATIRRHAEGAGTRAEEVQDASSQHGAQAENESKPILAQMALSADGAFVPLLGGLWAEARTLAIGSVMGKGECRKTTDLSSFSRMTDAATFTSLCTGEMQRRQLFQAKQVAGIMDGAEWLQGLLDFHRPDAIRILDFPHAAQRVSAILEAAQQTGQSLPTDALERSLHLLKHRGPRPLLRWLEHLTRKMAPTNSAHEDLAYLQKREALMQYPQYQAGGWPIGSGMVESANKLVVQARLKGSGMHWSPTHVNPMLALRSAVCSDRWDDTWKHVTAHALQQRQQPRSARVAQRQRQATSIFLLAWMRFLLPARQVQPSDAAPSQPVGHREPAKMLAGRPTAHHPWKRGLANLSAKN